MSVDPHIVQYAMTSLSLGLAGGEPVVGVDDASGTESCAPDDAVRGRDDVAHPAGLDDLGDRLGDLRAERHEDVGVVVGELLDREVEPDLIGETRRGGEVLAERVVGHERAATRGSR